MRALDSRGRPVPGIYIRDGVYSAGFKLHGHWSMRNLDAETLTEARRGRESLLAGLREGRIAAPDRVTFAEVFNEWQASRSLAHRTRAHEEHLLDRHLRAFKNRPVQRITSSEVAKLLRGMRERSVDGKPKPYSEWTRVAVCRIVSGTFAFALRRGIVTRDPMTGLARSELPTQRNAKKIAVLGRKAMAKLVAAGGSERWKAALGLAGFAGLRLGEIRGLRWEDVDFDGNAIRVRRSLQPDGAPKPPKTDAGIRVVPMLPELRGLVVAWKVRSPRTRPTDLVICAADGSHIQERNLRRALEAAKKKAKLDVDEKRLSWHSLRHSWASTLATDLELPATTLAQIIGHSDPGFTLRVYARDGRDEAAVVQDVLERAARLTRG
jgi:integrase